MLLIIDMKLVKLAVVAWVATFGVAYAGEDEDQTPMGREMEASAKALKSLRKIKKDDWDAMAKAARTAHEAFLKSMAYTPVLIKDMKDGPEKVKALADSRRLLGLCYAALCELEIAYLEKDGKKAKELISKWKLLKKEGHTEYSDD